MRDGFSLYLVTVRCGWHQSKVSGTIQGYLLAQVIPEPEGITAGYKGTTTEQDGLPRWGNLRMSYLQFVLKQRYSKIL